MDLKEYLENLEEQKEYVKVEDVGMINLDDIISVEEREFSWQDDDTERKYKRVILKIKGIDEEVVMPVSAAKSLKSLMKELGNTLKGFKVVREGEGLKTKYTVVPYVL